MMSSGSGASCVMLFAILQVEYTVQDMHMGVYRVASLSGRDARTATRDDNGVETSVLEFYHKKWNLE